MTLVTATTAVSTASHSREVCRCGSVERHPGQRPGHRKNGAKTCPIPIRSRESVKFSRGMPYFDTPQKCGQISVVASIPDSFGEAMLYV